MWGALFTAGAGLAQGLLALEQGDRAEKLDREKLEIGIEQNALNRDLDRERIAALTQNAQIGAEAGKAQTLAQLLARQGEQSGEAMSADQLSYARKPERTNDAVSMLIASLRGGR